jgi:lipoprotein-releasing system permease protein
VKRALASLWIWAARDALRRPGEALLSASAIAALVTVLSTALLLAQGLATTTRTVVQAGPSLVVRRVGPGGWEPMPLTALDKLRAVRGVTRARPRTWGLVRWRGQTVTVVGVSTPKGGAPVDWPAPAAGKAIVGPGLDLLTGDFVELDGVVRRTLEVQRALPASAGLIAHDIVLVPLPDARALLGLGATSASDVALDVFHAGEARAIRPDLSAALSFPLRITTREESLGALRVRIERASGVRFALLIPALLALALLTLAATRLQLGSRRDIGLLKVLGWDSGDVLRLQVFRALVIALPATAAGWSLAYLLVFVWGARWAGTLLFGWTGPAPRLILDPTGALLTMLQVAGLVLAPWLAAVVLPALRSAVIDPEQWIHGEQS